MEHHLKTLRRFFEPLKDGRKTFEIRKDGSGGRFDCTEILYEKSGKCYESWADAGSASPLEAIQEAVTNLLERPGVGQSEVAA